MLLQNEKKRNAVQSGYQMWIWIWNRLWVSMENLDKNLMNKTFLDLNFVKNFWNFLGHFICGYFNYANKFFVWKFPNLKNQMFPIHKNGSLSCAVHISFVKITFRSKNLTKKMKKSVVHDFCWFWLGIFPIFIFKWDISFFKKRAKTIPLR